MTQTTSSMLIICLLSLSGLQPIDSARVKQKSGYEKIEKEEKVAVGKDGASSYKLTQQRTQRCEGWCHNHKDPWSVRCGWTTNACSGCPQCGITVSGAEGKAACINGVYFENGKHNDKPKYTKEGDADQTIRFENKEEDWGWNNLCDKKECWTMLAKCGTNWAHHRYFAISPSPFPPASGWQARTSHADDTTPIIQSMSIHVSGAAGKAACMNGVYIETGKHNGKPEYKMNGNPFTQQSIRFEITNDDHHDWGYQHLCNQQGCWTMRAECGTGWAHHRYFAISSSSFPPALGWQARANFATDAPIIQSMSTAPYYQDMKWDKINSTPSRQESNEDCVKHCDKTEGCFGSTWWPNEKNCHIAEPAAKLVPDKWNAVSYRRTHLCESWCHNHKEKGKQTTWSVRCGWSTNACSGCSECRTPRCERWCSNHKKNGELTTWSVRCAWSTNACSGCAECPTA